MKYLPSIDSVIGIWRPKRKSSSSSPKQEVTALVGRKNSSGSRRRDSRGKSVSVVNRSQAKKNYIDSSRALAQSSSPRSSLGPLVAEVPGNRNPENDVLPFMWLPMSTIEIEYGLDDDNDAENIYLDESGINEGSELRLS